MSSTKTSADLLAAAERAAAGGDVAEVAALFGELDGVELASAERLRWHLLLLEAGHADLASRVEPDLPEAIAVEQPLEPDAGEADPLLDLPLLDRPPEPAERALVPEFLRWFGGRRDVYARQWYDERRRRSGYYPVEEPLTPEVVFKHLRGELTVGQYLLFPDGSVSFAVIDLDLEPGALDALRAAEGANAPALVQPSLRRHAVRVLEAGAELGLPLFAEDSGGRGVHIWLFLEPRRPARAARALLGLVLLRAGPQPAEVRAELFPKQDRPGPRGLSSLVKLPLGVHQATLRRCALLDEQLAPLDDGPALARLRAAPVDLIGDLLGRRVAPLPALDLDSSDGEAALPPLPQAPTARSLAEAMRAIEPGAAEREACERMLAGCGVLRELVKRAFDRRRLAPAEARALLYTVGLVGPDCRLIDEIFAVTQVGRRELERVRGALPAPAGCRRLRQLDAELARHCRCAHDAKAIPYPTPALFAVGTVRPAPPSWTPFAPWLEEGPLVEEPLQTLAGLIRRIEARLERLEPKDGPR